VRVSADVAVPDVENLIGLALQDVASQGQRGDVVGAEQHGLLEQVEVVEGDWRALERVVPEAVAGDAGSLDGHGSSRSW
jgi:hypothetical protein